jgi:hypothetical protein
MRFPKSNFQARFKSLKFFLFKTSIEEILFDKLLPNSELFWIDKCGHAAMMEEPDQFNALLFGWLSEKKL